MKMIPKLPGLYYLCIQLDSCTAQRRDKCHRAGTGRWRGSTEWRRCGRRKLADKCSGNRKLRLCNCRY